MFDNCSKAYTFPQKKLARAKRYHEDANRRYRCIETEIQHLKTKLNELEHKKMHVDNVRFRLNRHINNLVDRFAKSKGSRIDTPINADVISWKDGFITWQEFEYN